MDVFVKKEKEKLQNIISGLNRSELSEIAPEINFINYLLDELQTGNISDKSKKEIKKEIKKDLTDIEKETKKKQEENIGTYTLARNVKPNITEVPEEDINKALMVQASGVAYDSNFENAQQFLDNNNINYKIDTELSDQNGLVLHNEKTNDTKLAFRGTKFNSLDDLKLDAQILVGQETKHPQVIKAKQQAELATERYGLPSETLGYSKGGHLAISTADNTLIPKSTTFNSFLGYNSIGSQPTKAKHTLYRTTEDIPSIALGYKNNLDNYDVKTIRPLVDSLDVRQAHKLENFTTRKAKRATKSTLEELSTKNMEDTAKMGELATITDMQNYLNDESDVDIVFPKPPAENPLERMINARHTPVNPKQIVPDDFFDKVRNKNYNFDFDEFYRDKPFSMDDIPFMEQQLNITYPTPEELEFEAPQSNEFYEHGEPRIQTIPLEPDGETFDLEKMTHRFLKLGHNDMDFPVPVPENEPQIKPVEVPLLIPEPEKPIFPKEKTFSDWVHKFNGEKGVDTIIDKDGNAQLNSNRMHKNSRHAKMWQELGGEFTDQEKAHFDYYEDVMPDDKFLLSKNERNIIYENDENLTNSLSDKLNSERMKSMSDIDNYTSIPDATGTETRPISNDLIRSAHPMMLGIGLISGLTAKHAMNFIDPDKKIEETPRSAIEGSIAGLQTGVAAAYWGGEGLTAAALAPEVAAGAVAGVVGVESYKALKKAGVGENVAEVSSGSTAGAAAGATSALLAGALTGSELGAGEAGLTFGLSVVGGAIIGGIVGEGAYLYSKFKK